MRVCQNWKRRWRESNRAAACRARVVYAFDLRFTCSTPSICVQQLALQIIDQVAQFLQREAAIAGAGHPTPEHQQRRGAGVGADVGADDGVGELNRRRWQTKRTREIRIQILSTLLKSGGRQRLRRQGPAIDGRGGRGERAQSIVVRCQKSKALQSLMALWLTNL